MVLPFFEEKSMKRPFTSFFSNIPFVVAQTFIAGILLGFILTYSNLGLSQSSISHHSLMDVDLQTIKKSQNLIEKIKTLVKF